MSKFFLFLPVTGARFSWFYLVRGGGRPHTYLASIKSSPPPPRMQFVGYNSIETYIYIDANYLFGIYTYIYSPKFPFKTEGKGDSLVG